MSIPQGHRFRGRAARCSLKDHQRDVPVGRFLQFRRLKGLSCSTEYREDQSTLPPCPYFQSVEPSHPHAQTCWQGDKHRPARAVLVTPHLRLFIAAAYPRVLNLLKLHHRARAGGYFQKTHHTHSSQTATWSDATATLDAACVDHLICPDRDQLRSSEQQQLRSKQQDSLSSHLLQHSSPTATCRTVESTE